VKLGTKKIEHINAGAHEEQTIFRREPFGVRQYLPFWSSNIFHEIPTEAPGPYKCNQRKHSSGMVNCLLRLFFDCIKPRRLPC
jgi:hypothetical protein